MLQKAKNKLKMKNKKKKKMESTEINLLYSDIFPIYYCMTSLSYNDQNNHCKFDLI